MSAFRLCTGQSLLAGGLHLPRPRRFHWGRASTGGTGQGASWRGAGDHRAVDEYLSEEGVGEEESELGEGRSRREAAAGRIPPRPQELMIRTPGGCSECCQVPTWFPVVPCQPTPVPGGRAESNPN